MIRMLDYFAGEFVSATVYHYAGGTRDSEGRWTPGSESSASISVIAPQPVSADERIQIDDGTHIRDYVKTWVDDSIAFKTTEDGEDADQIVVSSQRYLVHQVDHWEPQGGFRAAYLRRIV